MRKFTLIKMRLQAGLKQRELACLLNMSQTALCDVEPGRRLVTPAIADSVGKAIDEANRAHRSHTAAALSKGSSRKQVQDQAMYGGQVRC